MRGAIEQFSAHGCKLCLEPIRKASPAQQKYDVILCLTIWQQERQVGKGQQERDRRASSPYLSLGPQEENSEEPLVKATPFSKYL